MKAKCTTRGIFSVVMNISLFNGSNEHENLVAAMLGCHVFRLLSQLYMLFFFAEY